MNQKQFEYRPIDLEQDYVLVAEIRTPGQLQLAATEDGGAKARRMSTERIGPLDAHLTGGSDGKGGGEGPIVVLLHGFGAPGTDLVGLERQLATPPNTRFVFPQAPLVADVGMPPPFEGRAWWHIDMLQLQQRNLSRDFRALSQHTPQGLVQARQALLEFLEALETRLKRGSQPLVLGGFSQGAMLSCDVALHSERPPSGLVLMSGSLIASAEWTTRLKARTLAGIPFLQSHGRLDPVLPFEVAEELYQLLTEQGWPGRFVPFQGGHGIGPEVFAALDGFLAQVLAQP